MCNLHFPNATLAKLSMATAACNHERSMHFVLFARRVRLCAEQMKMHNACTTLGASKIDKQEDCHERIHS